MQRRHKNSKNVLWEKTVIAGWVDLLVVWERKVLPQISDLKKNNSPLVPEIKMPIQLLRFAFVRRQPQAGGADMATDKYTKNDAGSTLND